VKPLFFALGAALLLASLAYVGLSISRNWSSIAQVNVQSWSWLLASVGLYAVSHLSTGASWPLAVRQLGERISVRDGLRIGLVAQIGKYLPGNVAHYAGRGVLAKQLGIPLSATGLSTAIELGSALVAAMLVATAGLLIDPRPIAWVHVSLASGAVISFAVLAALAAIGTWLYRRGTKPALLAGPTLCLALSFCLSSLSVYALSHALGYPGLSVAVATGSFALAWGLGFVIPGAPAGLGVREAALLATLGPMIGAGPAVTVALLHRLVTAAVDAVAALIGYAWLAGTSLAKK